MRFIRHIPVFALLLSLSSHAFGDALKNPAEAKQLADQVMAKVGQGNIENGIRLTKPFFRIPASEFEAMLEHLKLQLPVMSQRFGESIGYEFIREDRVGESLLRVIYIHRFEKHAMRWNFYFYRGKDGWILNTFKTDDDIRLLFEQ